MRIGALRHAISEYSKTKKTTKISIGNGQTNQPKKAMFFINLSIALPPKTNAITNITILAIKATNHAHEAATKPKPPPCDKF